MEYHQLICLPFEAADALTHIQIACGMRGAACDSDVRAHPRPGFTVFDVEHSIAATGLNKMIADAASEFRSMLVIAPHTATAIPALNICVQQRNGCLCPVVTWLVPFAPAQAQTFELAAQRVRNGPFTPARAVVVQLFEATARAYGSSVYVFLINCPYEASDLRLVDGLMAIHGLGPYSHVISDLGLQRFRTDWVESRRHISGWLHPDIVHIKDRQAALSHGVNALEQST